jgi:hypothetical protein
VKWIPPHPDPLQVRRSLIVRIDQAITPSSFGGDPAVAGSPDHVVSPIG